MDIAERYHMDTSLHFTAIQSPDKFLVIVVATIYIGRGDDHYHKPHRTLSNACPVIVDKCDLGGCVLCGDGHRIHDGQSQNHTYFPLYPLHKSDEHRQQIFL